ncbi:hypothetical protein CK227_10420 [Mesorhizobium sp. WSM4308]|nr:hypothetical protein CK227_10420 [Mesorhizobium sp. WSM4308]
MDYVATIKGLGGEPTQGQIDRTRKRYEDWLQPLKECDSRSQMTFHGVVFYDHPAMINLAQVKECIGALRAKFR